MTRKELLQVKESYRELARECAVSDAPYEMIAGISRGIALEGCYNHHERGQRLWAFFQTLKEIEIELYQTTCITPVEVEEDYHG